MPIVVRSKPLVTRKTWQEFQDAGLLWWVNRILHIFGWSIVFEVDLQTDEITDVYPARTTWRGFEPSVDEEGFVQLTLHLVQTSAELLREVQLNDSTSDEPKANKQESPPTP